MDNKMSSTMENQIHNCNNIEKHQSKGDIRPYQDPNGGTWTCNFCGDIEGYSIVKISKLDQSWSGLAICDDCINFLHMIKEKKNKIIKALKFFDEL